MYRNNRTFLKKINKNFDIVLKIVLGKIDKIKKNLCVIFLMHNKS